MFYQSFLVYKTRDYLKHIQVDLQECNVTFESWGHTTEQLLFQWKQDELKVSPSVEEGLNQHSAFVEFIDLTRGTEFSTGQYLY